VSASTTPGVLRPVQSLTTEHKVADLADLLIPWFEALEAGDEIPNSEIPTDDEVLAWTRSLFTDHGGRLRVRKSAPKGATGPERGVHGLYRWHASGGNLEGLFIAKWNAGEAWSRVETYISVLRIASGRESSPAIDAWRRTGLVVAAS
jgi:hypothetical protein